MKLLVICQDYPNTRSRDVSAFVHTRNREYLARGHRVSVLSFAAAAAYAWDGIEVFSEDVVPDVGDFDACVFHAPNLRNGYRFLWRHRRRFKKVCFVNHGHEFLNWFNYLPAPYAFDLSPARRLRRAVQFVYDRFKLRVWAWFFRRYRAHAPGVILVSASMRAEVERDMRIDFDRLGVLNTVINNPIHPAFTERVYQTPVRPDADFVTIRSFDNPKYAIDLVAECARLNPGRSFHVYGAGRYFDFYPPPPNLTVIKQKFAQADLPALLGRYRAALLPTRQDTQGVMMCEAACFGMPLWTSDLKVCREMIGHLQNVRFFDNHDLPGDLAPPPPNPRPDAARFAMDQTVARELDFIARLPAFDLRPPPRGGSS